MWLFKKKIVNDIPSNACWGVLLHQFKVDHEILSNKMRCVMKEGNINGQKATFLRIFDIRKIDASKIIVTGWEIFDQHPELIDFEGHVTESNSAFIERKNG